MIKYLTQLGFKFTGELYDDLPIMILGLEPYDFEIMAGQLESCEFCTQTNFGRDYYNPNWSVRLGGYTLAKTDNRPSTGLVDMEIFIVT